MKLIILWLLFSTNLAFADATTNRASKPISIAYRTGGIAGAVFGSGIEATYGLSPDLQVGFNFLSGSEDLKSYFSGSSYIEVTKAEVSAQHLFGLARYFFGNSFNLGLGLGRRVLGIDVGVATTAAVAKKSSIEVEITSSSTAIYALIGNVWTWDGGFVIGADWIGYSIPLASSSTVKETSVGVPDADMEKLKKDNIAVAEDLGESAIAMALILTLGYAF